MATEDERALAYKEMMKARERYTKASEKALAGSTTARQALAAAWEPLALWMKERRERC